MGCRSDIPAVLCLLPCFVCLTLLSLATLVLCLKKLLYLLQSGHLQPAFTTLSQPDCPSPELLYLLQPGHRQPLPLQLLYLSQPDCLSVQLLYLLQPDCLSVQLLYLSQPDCLSVQLLHLLQPDCLSVQLLFKIVKFVSLFQMAFSKKGGLSKEGIILELNKFDECEEESDEGDYSESDDDGLGFLSVDEDDGEGSDNGPEETEEVHNEAADVPPLPPPPEEDLSLTPPPPAEPPAEDLSLTPPPANTRPPPAKRRRVQKRQEHISLNSGTGKLPISQHITVN